MQLRALQSDSTKNVGPLGQKINKTNKSQSVLVTTSTETSQPEVVRVAGQHISSACRIVDDACRHCSLTVALPPPASALIRSAMQLRLAGGI